MPRTDALSSREATIAKVLELAAAHRPDICRCIQHKGKWVECAEHKMQRLASAVLNEEDDDA